MSVFPFGAAVVSLVLAGLLTRQYLQRRRLYQGLWALALAMYAGASGAVFLGVLDGWSSGEFRVYYLLGAILNVPYLALGELYLLFRERWFVHALFVLLLVGTAVAIGSVRTAALDASLLSEPLPLGKEVFGDGSRPHLLAQYFGWGGYLVILAGTVWSALSIRGSPELRSRFLATLLIALGATVAAIGSGVGAGLLGSPIVLSTGLLVAAVLIFAGFVNAARRAPVPPAVPGA